MEKGTVQEPRGAPWCSGLSRYPRQGAQQAVAPCPVGVLTGVGGPECHGRLGALLPGQWGKERCSEKEGGEDPRSPNFNADPLQSRGLWPQGPWRWAQS